MSSIQLAALHMTNSAGPSRLSSASQSRTMLRPTFMRISKSSLDIPRTTVLTVQSHKLQQSISPPKEYREPPAGTYRTINSITRFAIIVPESAAQAPFSASVKLKSKANATPTASYLKRHNPAVPIAHLEDSFNQSGVSAVSSHASSSANILIPAILDKAAYTADPNYFENLAASCPALRTHRTTRRMPRKRPALPQLDPNVTNSGELSSSSPQIPGPLTPIDETVGDRNKITRKGEQISKRIEKLAVAIKPKRKGVVYQRSVRAKPMVRSDRCS